MFGSKQRKPGFKPISRMFMPMLVALLCPFASLAAGPDPETSSLLKLAQQELAARNYLNAMIHADKLIKLHPENQAAHYYRGLSLHYLKNAKDARAEYEKAAIGTDTEVAKRANAALATLGGKKATATSGGKPSKPATTAGTNQTASPGAATVGAPKPTLVMFLTDDTMSLELGAILKDLQSKYSGKIKFQEFRFEDAKNKPEIEKYNIEGAPIAIFLNKEGQTVDRMEDFVDCRPIFKEKLEALLN
jgi:tetratricopeptide (TPR) repeat protein